MCIPQGECRPIPCRIPALRYGLRRGLGSTAHSAIGTRYGGSRGASAALNPGLRPFAYAGSAPLPWRHPSRLRRHRVSPLVRYACTLVPPDAALCLPSLSLLLHCRWRAVLLAHSLTLMPTRAFNSADAMLLVLHRQSIRATSAAERCSALRASRRCLSGDAGASSGAGSLMPHRHPSFLRQHRASVPQSASHRSSQPTSSVRADRPHTHPSAMTASPIASLKTHTAFLHGHAGLPQLIIAPTSYAANHGYRESVAHDMTQPCTSLPFVSGCARSIWVVPLIPTVANAHERQAVELWHTHCVLQPTLWQVMLPCRGDTRVG